VFLSRLEECSSLKYRVGNRAVRVPEEYVRVLVHQDHTGARIYCEIITTREKRCRLSSPVQTEVRFPVWSRYASGVPTVQLPPRSR